MAQSVPMWGYSCGAAVTGSTATCAAVESNGGDRLVPRRDYRSHGATGGLTINLTNNLLSFAERRIPCPLR